MSLNIDHANAISDNVPAPPPIAITASAFTTTPFLINPNPVGITMSAYSFTSVRLYEGVIAIVQPRVYI